jgi:hypothetical protein
MASYFLIIDIRVKMTSRKFSVKKKDVHFSIPSSRSLLKTIERFLKEENKVGVIISIAMRLFHVDLFLYISMQKVIFNIHLMDLPSM